MPFIRSLFWLGVTLITLTARAQDADLIQLSGMVVQEQTLKAIPYATVYNKTKKLGTVTNFYGFFTLVASQGDTIRFRTVGFKTRHYLVPEMIDFHRSSAIITMDLDTISLETVVIYPWPSREEFREAFLSLKLREAESDMISEYLGFRRLDHIEPYEISPIWNPVSYFYENVIKPMKARKVKSDKAKELPKFE